MARAAGGMIGWRSILLAHCILFGLASRHAVDASISGRSSSEQFMLPILLFGPSNQAVGLKEGVAFSKLMGRTAVLPNLYEHYSQLETVVNKAQQARYVEKPMAFDLMFDTGPINEYTKAVSAEELLGAGWDGRLQALLYWSEGDLKYLERVKVSNMSAGSAVRISMDGRKACRKAEMDKLRERIRKHRFVGILIYNKLVKNARHTSLARPAIKDYSNPCYQSFRAVSAHMVKSPAVQSIAQEYITTVMGGQPFVAVHVRPYPDTCLTLWARGETPNMRSCDNHKLHKQIGPETAAAVKSAKLEGRPVFVASHPSIRPMIIKIFQQYDLIPAFLEHTHMRGDYFAGGGHRASNVSLSLVMYVEQEIAFRSTAFVGTEDSSITGIIRQQRTASILLPGTSTSVFG